MEDPSISISRNPVKDISISRNPVKDISISRGVPPRPVKDINEASIENLQLAWRCILEGEEGRRYKKMMVENSIEEGKGLHIFKFGSTKFVGGSTRYNCEYYFVTPDSDIWKKMVVTTPSYDHSIHYAVCVSVPHYDMGDERIQNVRLFNLEDQILYRDSGTEYHKEVEL